MVKNPPDNMPRITPYLYYKNLAAAMEWVGRAFGLKVRFSMPGPDGKPMHGEMTFAEGVVMMGTADPKSGGKSPQDLGAATQGLYIYVDDVDAHYRKAKEAGARISMEPADMFWGDRVYGAQDLEGHHWSFARHIKDVAPEDMKLPEEWK
jgi:PhnB protein